MCAAHGVLVREIKSEIVLDKKYKSKGSKDGRVGVAPM